MMNAIAKRRKVPMGQVCLHIFFILLSLCYILPLILLVSVSLEGASSQYFTLFPKQVSLAAYRILGGGDGWVAGGDGDVRVFTFAAKL